MIHIKWCPAIESGVGSLGVVETKEARQTLSRLRYRLIVMDIDLFVLDRPPQALNKNVVIEPAAAVHADSYVMSL